MKKDLPWWFVDISIENGSRNRRLELEIQAVTSRAALVKAISSVRLRQGELFHNIQIGRPCGKDDRRMRRVMVDGIAFMKRHDAAFRELADR